MTNKPLGEWLRQTVARLQACTTDARLEAQVIAAHVLGQTRTWVAAHPDFLVSGDVLGTMTALINRRCDGAPLPYLVGHREFFGLDFMVSPDVLIPRPETELLVERALEWLKTHQRWNVVDVGTGSGCIAVSIGKNCAEANLYAVDVSRRALRIAINNIQKYSLERRIKTWQGNLLSACGIKFDLVCANLPYIPSPKLTDLPVTQYEPLTALDGGPDGFGLIQNLLIDAHRWMASGGLMLLEIESGQAELAVQEALRVFPRSQIKIISDLANLPRILSIEYLE